MTQPNGGECRFDVWRDDYGEWVWACLCERGRLHGGYATEESAKREAVSHATT